MVWGNTQAQFYSLACKKSSVTWKDSFCWCVFNSIWKLRTKFLKNLDVVSAGTSKSSWPWDLGLRQSDMFLLVINITDSRWYQGFMYSDTKSGDCGKTASQIKWEAEVVIFLSRVLLSTYWSTSFKSRQKKNNFKYLFLLESCRLALPLRPNRFLLTVIFSGTLLQAAACKGKLPTTPKYVLLLISSNALHMLN